MALKVGIIGLPNVGKSTLFNALLKKQVADVANYPFCTIEPNIGVIEVPDERLPILAEIVKTNKIVPAAVEFYDIAGLVKGASKGEGLGNQFLSHIKEVDLIVHVVRLFDDNKVTHVNNTIDPVLDIDIIEQELILADLAVLTRLKEPKPIDTKEEKYTYQAVQKIIPLLNQGKPVYRIPLTKEEKQTLKRFNLLSVKEVVYVFNVSQDQLKNHDSVINKIKTILQKSNSTEIDPNTYLYLCAKLEEEIVVLDSCEQIEYLRQFGLSQSGLNRLIKRSYALLALISFLTGGEKQVRAWTVKKGSYAPQAAGIIHTDFEKHFIKAEVVPFETFVKYNGWQGCREAGKSLIAGKDYIVKDGDVIDFKVGV